MSQSLPTAPFGSTGHDSTRVLFGAAALGAMSQERADATMEVVRNWGINHIDTAASYGESEDRLKPWLAQHRNEVFLATKTGERNGDAARAELERSLTRMGVDHIDMIQIHNLVEEDEWQTAHGPGGAVESLSKARDEGLVSHIGVTGHGVRIAGMHLRSLERFPFAAVLFPYSYLMMENPAYRHDVEALLERCAADGVAAQTIKAIARGRWAEGSEAKKFSWYEPLSDVDAISRAVQWALADERVFLNTSSDARLMELALSAASSEFTRPSDEVMAADVANEGMTPLFDGRELERI